MAILRSFAPSRRKALWRVADRRNSAHSPSSTLPGTGTSLSLMSCGPNSAILLLRHRVDKSLSFSPGSCPSGEELTWWIRYLVVSFTMIFQSSSTAFVPGRTPVRTRDYVCEASRENFQSQLRSPGSLWSGTALKCSALLHLTAAPGFCGSFWLRC